MTGEGPLRADGWIRGSEDTSDRALAPLGSATDGEHPVIDGEAVGTVTEAWLPARIPDPEAGVAEADAAGPYRRSAILPRLPQALVLVAVAVGVLLAGTSVVVGLFPADRETRLAPPPSPDVVDQEPERRPDRQRLGSTASPAPSLLPSPAPSSAPTPAASPTNPPVQRFFEAEAAELGRHAQLAGFDGAAGGQVVRLTGNRDGTFVRFTEVVAVDSGQYEVTIGYFSEQDRAGAISVNDGPPAELAFPSRGEGGTVGSITVSVELAPGSNTIQVSSSGGAPLSIDGIVVTD